MIDSQKLDEIEYLQQQIVALQKALKMEQDRICELESERGMAEVAAGVLHNIGNTLTPSKIVISTLLRKMEQSTLRKHLRTILHPFEQLVLDSDLVEGEKQKLLKIIKILPETLEEEYVQYINNITNVQDKQEHIISIIALQGRYAHFKSDYASVDVEHIINDAISIQSESLEKRGISVSQDIQVQHTLKIQELNLLQTLINIIKNAYEAIDMYPSSEKVIIITARECDDQQIEIKIRDSGIGFEKGTEQGFFDFGYTSKESGSGFGLHFCCYFIQSIGGNIYAQSDGIGKGAEFIIVLPLMQDV